MTEIENDVVADSHGQEVVHQIRNRNQELLILEAKSQSLGHDHGREHQTYLIDKNSWHHLTVQRQAKKC